jgi:hypothetical protein
MGYKHLLSIVFITFSMVACEQKAPASPAQTGPPSVHRTDGGAIILYEASKHGKGSTHRHAPADAKKAIKKGKTAKMKGTVGTVKIGRPGSPATKKVAIKKAKNPTKTPTKKPAAKLSTAKAAPAKTPAK